MAFKLLNTLYSSPILVLRYLEIISALGLSLINLEIEKRRFTILK